MLRRLLLSLCLLVAAASSARAEIILGNLAGSNVGGNTGLHLNIHRALSFIMGSQSYTLDSLSLRLNYLTGTPVVELHSDGGTQPGSLITTFNNPPVNGGGTQVYSFVPQSTPILAANTKYWIEVYGTDTSNPIQWNRSSPDLTPSGTAASWQDSATYSGGSWGSSSQINTFQLDGTQYTAVPEPTSFLLVAGLAAAGGLRRRLRRR